MLFPIELVLCVFPASVPAVPLPAAQGDPDRAELEADFERLLTGARLVGYFTLGDNPDAGLQEDSYTIQRVTKIDDERWRFEALVEYGEAAIPVAIALPVRWAGDTPVICVTDFDVPMMGKYTARVLFHGDQYAGTWSGKGHGGQMFGRVERADAAPPAEDEPAANGDEGEEETGQNWPSFRGTRGSGVSEGYATPVEWNVDQGVNVKWRAEVAGLAHSSPVIWDDKLFVTSAVRVDGEQELTVGLFGSIAPVEDESPFGFELYCFDKRTGELLWASTAWEGVPAIKRHPKGSHAASSPAVSAEHVVAFFGSEGLYCYDHAGKLRWKKDFGVLDSGYYQVPDAQWGFSSSPVLHDGIVIVQCDVQGESFIAGLRAADGEELWRTPRDEVPTWSSPTVDARAGRSQVIVNGYKHIGGYDLRTGEELWKLVGGGDIPVPTPVVSHGMIFIMNAHGRMAPIYAIDANARGTLTMDADQDEYMAWSHKRGGNYMQTPLVYGEELYCCNDAGILTCYDVTTGDELYSARLGSGRTGFTSSGVAADGKLYFSSEEGDVHVVRAGRDFELLAVNSLGEECMATPAISEGVLFYRTRQHLVAVAD